MIKYNIEYTDTFNGEANYSWVLRNKLYVDEKITELQLVRKAKKLVNITNVRCKRIKYEDTIVLYPYNSATVLFITFEK